MTIFGALRRIDENRYRAELYRAWSTALGAGLAHAAALEQIGRMGSAATEETRRYLLVGVQQQKPIAALVRARPTLFHPFEAAILAAGDESGRLVAALGMLADFYLRDFKRMLKVRMLMGYPVYAGVVGSFVITHPFLRRGGWRAYTYAIIGALVMFMLFGGIFISLFAGFLSNGPAYTLPRFLRAMVTALEAGVPAGRAVRLAVDVSRSAELRAHFAKRSERELATTPLGVLLDKCRIVPPALHSQLRVADVTSDYVYTLRHFADQLDGEAA